MKEKIGRIMAPSLDRNQQGEEEFNVVQDKIRKVKMEIANKLNHLKNRRIFDGNFSPFGQDRANRKKKFVPINIALTELKDATEVINRELIRQREEIKILVKELYGNDI